MLKSNNPTAKQSQTWILNSLLKLLETKQYQQITVSEICKNALLDRRTFYRNFESKDDVMELQIKVLCDEYVEMLRNTQVLSIAVIARTYFEFWRKNIHFLNILYRDELTMFMLGKYDELIPNIYRIFYDTVSDDLEYTLAFQTGGFWNLVVKWVANGADKSPSEMADIVAKLALAT